MFFQTFFGIKCEHLLFFKRRKKIWLSEIIIRIDSFSKEKNVKEFQGKKIFWAFFSTILCGLVQP